jgi:hypothetical protein
MNRAIVKRVFPYLLAWAGLVVLSGAAQVAQAQNPAPDAAQAQPGQRTDGQIEMDVVHALDASKALKNDLITAATIQGEVTLSGTVSSDASSELAESISAHVAGVSKVNNNLKVGNPQDAQAAADPAAQQMADNQPDDAAQAAPPAANDGPMPSQPQGQDQAQGQAPPPPYYPPARPQYAPPPQYAQGPPPPPPGPTYQQPTGPVTVAQGTLLQLRTNEPVGTKKAKDGEPVEFTVIRDVAVGGVLAIPRGATVHGVVSEVKKVGSGDLGGSPVLALKLTSMDLGGQSYPLDSDQFKVKGPNKAGQTVGSAVGGGIIGTIIGCAVGRGVGCAIGAGAGVAAGTAASAASSGPGIWIPAEALVTFHLNTPLTVNPVSAQEASRLAQGLYPGGPNLYRRGPYPYYGAQYAAASPYPYGYGPVYYRPYYMVGGEYYWR